MEQFEPDSIQYLEKAPVPRAIAHMAIPMILGMVVNLIYNIIDAFFIGQLNNTAMLAAITLALPFSAAQMGIGQIFGIGGSTYISRLLGEKNETGAQTASSTNFWLSILSGLLFLVICLPLLSPILAVMGAKGETLAYTRNFILIFAIGSPFVITNFTLSETVRGEGASTESMVGMILSVAVNILLDPIFIFLLHMNVMGAALATVLANLFAVVYYVWFLKSKSKVQSVDLKDIRLTGEILSNIFKVGISAFLLCGFMIASSLMFNNYAMMYGENVVAALGIANRVVQLCEFVGMGLYTGIVPLLAYAYSSGNRKRLGQVLKTTILYLTGITLGIGFLIYLFRPQILALFSTDPGVLSVGVIILNAMLVSTLFSGYSGLFTSMFQAFGKGLQSNVMSVARGIALIPIIILGNLLFGLNGIIWSLTLSEGCAFLVGFLLWVGSRKNIMTAASEAGMDLIPEAP